MQKKQRGRTQNNFAGKTALSRIHRKVVLGCLAAKIAKAGASRPAITAALLKENKIRFKAPLDADAVRSIVKATPTAPSTADVGWPEAPNQAIYRGLVKKVLTAVLPHTEADPVAIVGQLLTVFGNAIGRGPHFTISGIGHHMNLFTVVVGATADGKKGTSWGIVDRVFGSVASDWKASCVKTGVASGQGLISMFPTVADDEDDEQDQPALEEPRLLAVEKEFGRLLKACRANGALSAVMCNAWDGDAFGSITKHDNRVVVGAHVSMVGHITPHELRRTLNRADAANGFGNRFLWLAVRKSKSLPDGGNLREADLVPLHEELVSALKFASKVGSMTKSPSAQKRWRKFYLELSESAGDGGIVDELTARAPSQVMRIACLYALLDRSTMIKTQHLEAAMALWRYAAASVRYLFDTGGDDVGEKILQALRAAPKGLTKRDVRDLFSRSRPARVVNAALGELQSKGLIYSSRETGTGGRPATRWRAVITT